MKRAILTFTILVAGCGGTWSDADIEFLRPLPTSKDLAPTTPAASNSQKQGLGQSNVYSSVVSMTSGIDSFIVWITGALDSIRTFPPTTRSPAGRVWGPWSDNQHAGYRDQVVMTRDDSTTPPIYHYELQMLPPGGAWTTLIDGAFQGDRATNGNGAMALHVGVARDMGLGDPKDPNTLEVDIRYDLAGGQATVSTSIQAISGTGVAQADISYIVTADGGGEIQYSIDNIQVPNTNPPTAASVDVHAQWLANKSGRSDDVFRGGSLGAAVVQYSECWDTTFNQVFQSAQDTCNGAANCACQPPAQVCQSSEGSPTVCSILAP